MQKMIVTRQLMCSIVASVLFDQFAEGRHLYQVGYLGENVFA